ncbi:MAG: Sjogren's syndrome/scleroderma autoantigen 1 family protein [Nitrososphaerales archaeon]
MVAVSRERLAAASEMLRKGATLLREPCPKCGGVQIKYRGEVSCIVCGLAKDVSAATLQLEAKLPSLKEIIETKALEVAFALRDERSIERQKDLLDLLERYIELLLKLSSK